MQFIMWPRELCEQVVCRNILLIFIWACKLSHTFFFIHGLSLHSTHTTLVLPLNDQGAQNLVLIPAKGKDSLNIYIGTKFGWCTVHEKQEGVTTRGFIPITHHILGLLLNYTRIRHVMWLLYLLVRGGICKAYWSFVVVYTSFIWVPKNFYWVWIWNRFRLWVSDYFEICEHTLKTQIY